MKKQSGLFTRLLCWPLTAWRRYRDYPRLEAKLRETEDRYESMLETLHQRHADIVENLYRRQNPDRDDSTS